MRVLLFASHWFPSRGRERFYFLIYFLFLCSSLLGSFGASEKDGEKWREKLATFYERLDAMDLLWWWRWVVGGL